MPCHAVDRHFFIYFCSFVFVRLFSSLHFWITTRYTNFSLESVENTPSGSVGLGKRTSVTIARNGDLISDIVLEIVLVKGSTRTYFAAEAAIAEVEIEIGGQKCDKMNNHWMRIRNELYLTDTAKDAYRRMVDFDEDDPVGCTKRLYLPLQFWFCSTAGSVGNALPLIALQYHEVKLLITFAAEGTVPGVTEMKSCSVYVDYIYLDTDERRRFAQSSHEYLITQVQHQGGETIRVDENGEATTNVRLNFNHPTKLLAWVFRKSSGRHGEYTCSGDYGNVVTSEVFDVLKSSRLLLNGHDRYSTRPGKYFNFVQPYLHMKTRPAAGIHSYSFSLSSNTTQPSGSCNLSRIDNATIVLTTKKAKTGATLKSAITDVENETLAIAKDINQVLCFAENYNVLRIMSGMGGLAYSN